jgi:hypothetical protein
MRRDAFAHLSIDGPMLLSFPFWATRAPARIGAIYISASRRTFGYPAIAKPDFITAIAFRSGTLFGQTLWQRVTLSADIRGYLRNRPVSYYAWVK